MPVQRRSRWANAFQALAENVSQQANQWGQRLQADVVRKDQQKFDLQKQNDAQLQQFIQTLGAHPEQYDQLNRGAKAQGIDLSSYAPTPQERLKPLTDQIGNAKTPFDLPIDLGAKMESMGVSTAPGFGPMQQGPAPLESTSTGMGEMAPPDLPSTPMGPVMNPMLQSIMQQAGAANARMDTEDTKKAQQARTMAYNTGMGSGAAATQTKNANFPTELQQHGQLANVDAMAPFQPNVIAGGVNKIKAETPGLVNRAGQTAGATTRAGLAPDIIASEATKAGAVTSATEAAKGPQAIDKQAAAFYTRANAASQNASMLEGDVNALGADYLPDALQSEKQKQFNLARREFVLSALRKETGASISKDEMNSFNKYFAAPGDPPDVIKAKQDARQRLLDGLKYEGQKGLDKMPMMSMPDVKPGSTLDMLLGGSH